MDWRSLLSNPYLFTLLRAIFFTSTQEIWPYGACTSLILVNASEIRPIQPSLLSSFVSHLLVDDLKILQSEALYVKEFLVDDRVSCYLIGPTWR
jgi:hypothetical protein